MAQKPCVSNIKNITFAIRGYNFHPMHVDNIDQANVFLA
jgi:hypothetical protein